MSHSPSVIVVDGIIASGKTTYTEMICEELKLKGIKAVIVQEPVQQWIDSGILSLFYEDQKRWAYTFQAEAFRSRVMENVKMYEQYGNTVDVYILERSPFTDPLFMAVQQDDGFIDDVEMKLYEGWVNMWKRLMPYSPTGFVYLRPSVDTCMERLRVRNRGAECGVCKEYQQKLMNKHDNFLCSPDFTDRSSKTSFTSRYDNKNEVEIDGKKVEVKVIDLEKDYRKDSEEKEKLVNEFMGLIGNKIKNNSSNTITLDYFWEVVNSKNTCTAKLNNPDLLDNRHDRVYNTLEMVKATVN